jgi:hypothetical protein
MMGIRAVGIVAMVLVSGAPLGAGCDRGHEPEPETRAAASVAPAAVAPPEVVSLSERIRWPAPARLVAIGDLHGDLDHARRALRLGGAIDAHDAWSGGALVVVQTGDEIDRGDDDRAILDEVDSWKTQAHNAGGAFVALLGNHELMNASLDFRYVTPGGLAAFAPLAGPDAGGLGTATASSAQGRAAAFTPGGSYADRLAARPIVAMVGDTVFVHGGILPKHVAYGLDRMNDEVDAWLVGKRSAPPAIAVAQDGPVWTRLYSDGPGDCATLRAALAALGARRMVVGHTVQRGGITSSCDGAVWRIDVGLSRAFGGPIEALQIEGDTVTVLREAAPGP